MKAAPLLLALFSLTARSAVLYTEGHADIGIGYEDNELEPHFHAEEAIIDGSYVEDQEYEADEVVINVGDSSYDYWVGLGGRPAGASWDPVGVSAGTLFWFLPQTQTLAESLALPFLGVGSEELSPGDWTGNLLVALTSVSGPGEFSMWQDGFFGPTFFMSTANGISGADSMNVVPGGHDHYNFAFTSPGFYEVTWEISGTHSLDGAKSASGTYGFLVGPVAASVPEPVSAGMLVAGAILIRALRRRPAR